MASKSHTPVNTAPRGDALTADYRRRIRASTTPTASRSSSQPVRAPEEAFNITFVDDPARNAPRTTGDPCHTDWMDLNFGVPLATPVASSSRAITLNREPAPLSDEEVQGLNDLAVMTPRPPARTQGSSALHSARKNTVSSRVVSACYWTST